MALTKHNAKQAATTVINRLVDPVTENFLVENWLPTSAIPDLLGEEVLKGARKRFYSVSDKLLLNQEEIEAHLRQAQQRHFNLKRTLVLYDLTNTHFEGECRSNKKAKRGKNKQKRNDCCQVVVGMVLDEFGFELGHKTFDGNLNDSQSLVKMIDSLQKICTKDDELISSVKPLIIVDAGVATKKNLKLLRKKGYSYLVNDSRRKRSKYREAFSQSAGFAKISDRFKNGQEKPSVEVKLIEETSTETELIDQLQADGTTQQMEQQSSFTEHLVLCKSDSRRNKELAMVSTAEKRFLQQLKALSERIEKGRLKDPVKIERAIGRIKAKNPRVATFYKVIHENKQIKKLIELALKESHGWEYYEKEDEHKVIRVVLPKTKLPLSIAILRNHQTKKDIRCFGSTDPTLSSKDILSKYRYRWLIENGIKDLVNSYFLDHIYGIDPEKIEFELYCTTIARLAYEYFLKELGGKYYHKEDGNKTTLYTMRNLLFEKRNSTLQQNANGDWVLTLFVVTDAKIDIDNGLKFESYSSCFLRQ